MGADFARFDDGKKRPPNRLSSSLDLTKIHVTPHAKDKSIAVESSRAFGPSPFVYVQSTTLNRTRRIDKVLSGMDGCVWSQRSVLRPARRSRRTCVYSLSR